MKHKIKSRRLKLKSLVVVILVILTFLPFAAAGQTMVVEESSDTQTTYALSMVRKLTFSAGNVHIQNTDKTSGIYTLNGLSYIRFAGTMTGLDKPQKLDGTALIMYPNPVSSMLKIELRGVENASGIIRILSLEGKELHVQKTKSPGIVTLDLRHLSKGIYLCHYNSGMVIETEKIIKQ